MSDLEMTYTVDGLWALASERYGTIKLRTWDAARKLRCEILRCDDLRCAMCGGPGGKLDAALGLVCDDCLLDAVGVAYG